jgi:hypothetical protein
MKKKFKTRKIIFGKYKGLVTQVTKGTIASFDLS